jgi:GT2 family glycosyltransferase
MVDDGSGDDSVDYTRNYFPKVRVIINEKNLGFARSVNVGVSNSKGEYIAMLNNDTEVDKKWLSELVKFALDHPEKGSYQSKILLFNEKNLINTAGNKINFLGIGWSGNYRAVDGEEFSTPKEITYASGAGMLMKKSLFVSIGMFDEAESMYHDDLDLGWRLLLLGYTNYLVPSSIVFHKYNYSRNKKKMYFLETSRLIMLGKNYESKTLVLLAPAFVLMEGCILAYALVNGWFVDKLLSYSYIAKSIPTIQKKRKDVTKMRRVSDDRILPKFEGGIQFKEVDSVFTRLANPFFNLYFNIMKSLL